MIIKNSGDGKTFKARVEYLTHDVKAKSAERIEWTHTFNLANTGEHVPAAVNEMYLTAENAELLKQQAGFRGGGRSTERPVKHYSLSWAIPDNPTQEHMIETAMGFLRHMGWQEHQVLLISHNDKPYKHVHLLINAVHPLTGLRLNDDFENKRAQKWAAQYELQQGKVYCEERFKEPRQREKNMPRNIWMELKPYEQQFQAEAELTKGDANNPNDKRNGEWKALKILQRAERLEFVASWRAESKELRNEIYREMRSEFRDRWAAYFWSKRHGLDAEDLAARKDRLISDQKAFIEGKSGLLKELKTDRQGVYRELLDNQKEARGELKFLQQRQLDTSNFFKEQFDQYREDRLHTAFREAAAEVGIGPARSAVPRDRKREERVIEEPTAANSPDGAGPRSRSRDRLGAGLASFAGTLLADLANLGSAKPEPISKQDREDAFREAAENALKQQQHRSRETEDDVWRDRQRTLYRE
jgi:hypothetical protein